MTAGGDSSRLVAVTQRVDVSWPHGERRDAIDHRWTSFLHACGLTPIALPNDIDAAHEILGATRVAGVVLTGGNDLVALGGDAPERDAVETAIVERALRTGLPVLGVCRGMQLIQRYFGASLRPVDEHVACLHDVIADGEPRVVNSFHRWATEAVAPPLFAWATTGDGVVEAVRHDSASIAGVMWHPERVSTPTAEDVALFRRHFAVEAEANVPAEGGTVYWITGLSAAGKTTVGRQLQAILQAAGRPVVLLDGDEVRALVGDPGHALADRKACAQRYGQLGRLISSQGVDVVVCTISMFEECWRWNRANIPRYREIYLRVPIDTLVARDPQGLYGAAHRGELTNVWGVDLDWTEPDAHLVVDNPDGTDPRAVAAHIASVLA